MDNTENTSSAIEVIDTISFGTSITKGYRIQEVDDYLERLSVEIRQLKDQLQQARQVSRQAAERINQLESGKATAASTGPTPIIQAAAPRPATNDASHQISSMIAMAQEFIEQKQAEAESKASQFIGEAQERAREIISEARSRAEDEVNRLNGLKQRLSEDVDTLTRQLESERARLGTFLNEFSRWIEGSLSIGGAARPASPARQPAPAPAPQAQVPPRPSAPPPPAPAPAPQQTFGQSLSFDKQSERDRS